MNEMPDNIHRCTGREACRYLIDMGQEQGHVDHFTCFFGAVEVSKREIALKQ